MPVEMAIVVQTCDKYRDVWDSFYQMFDRYWPNCPFKIYHVTESIRTPYSKAHNILTGQDLEWSDRLKRGLKEIEEPYVLLLLEDYLLIKPVRNELFIDHLQLIQDERPAYLRIFPVPGPKKDYKHYPHIGTIDKGDSYSISTQATIWDKSVLEDFLIPEESIWDFEVMGTQRASTIQKVFLGVRKEKNTRKAEEGNYAYTYFCTAVFKGKWMKPAVELLKREGISIDLDYRQQENWLDRIHRTRYHKSPVWLRHIMDYARNTLK